MRTRELMAATLIAGCTGGSTDPSVPGVSPWPMDAGADAVSTAGGSTGSTPATDDTVGEAETAASAGTQGATTGGIDDGSSSSETGEGGGEGGRVVPCSLEEIDPSQDPSTVIDYGDGVGQIPTDVGEALLRHCGCHYTDDIQIPGLTDYNSDDVPLSTWDDFQVPFVGVFPMAFEGTVWEATEVRVTFHQPLPMPPGECDIDGRGTIISDEDFVLFAQWFDAGAPDGASWSP